MWKNIIWVLVAVCVFQVGFSQDFDQYKNVQCEGDIPEQLLKKSSEIIAEQEDEFVSGDSRREKKSKKKFLIQSSFGTQNILLSGNVLFNDPLTTYLNQVADELLANNKELRNEINIYTYRSPIVNAYTFNDGTILFTMGMLAQVQNEAQLAFVLAHEIAHYINQDAIELFLESEELDRGKGLYKDLSFQDKILEQAKYSQEKEQTADLDGLELYLESKYSLEAVEGVFDVLKYSYLPFNDIVWNKSFFEGEGYVFPEGYELSKVKPISVEVEETDPKSTHPSSDERKDIIVDLIEKENGGANRKMWMVSKDEFERIQKMARFELPFMYLEKGFYADAIYNSYLLLQDEPDSRYVHKIVAKALTASALLYNANEYPFDYVNDIRTDIEGESQQLFFFLDTLGGSSEKEYNIMALRKVYETLLKFPEDEDLESMTLRLMGGLIDEHDETIADLSKAYPVKQDTLPNPPPTDTLTQEEKEADKYAKIKELEKEVVETAYYRYAFTAFKDDSRFSSLFKQAQEEVENSDSDNNEVLTGKERKRIDKKGYSLGVEKLVLVNPFYAKINTKKNEAYKMYKSEEGQDTYAKLIEDEADRTDIDLTLVDVRQLEASETDAFNDAALLKNWLGEQLRLDDEISYSSFDMAERRRLIEKYNTPYFMWSGMISLKERSRAALAFFMAFYIPPVAVLMAAKAGSKANNSIFINLIYNIETNEIVLGWVDAVNYKGKKTLVRGRVHHTFNQISSNPK